MPRGLSEEGKEADFGAAVVEGPKEETLAASLTQARRRIETVIGRLPNGSTQKGVGQGLLTRLLAVNA